MKVVILSVIAAITVLGQTASPSPPAVTADEVAFIRHLLASIASPEFDPNILAMNEAAIISLYGLDKDEAATLHAAGQSFAAIITSFRAQKAAAVQPGRPLTDADRTMIGNLSAALIINYTNLAASFLGSLRSERAALLRLQAALVAQGRQGKEIIKQQ